MLECLYLLRQAGAKSISVAAVPSFTVNVLIIATLVILAIALFLFCCLVVLRLVGSRRERRFQAKKDQLNPLIYDLLTEDRSAQDVVGTIKSVVPARDRSALEQVMLENIRFLKGNEQEALTGVFDELGFVDEDISNLGRRGMVRRAESAYHLGTMRSARAVPALKKALQYSSQPPVVFSCLNALSKIGTAEALDAVVNYLALAPEMETLRIAEVLLERKSEFATYLEHWLRDGRPDTAQTIFLVNIIGAMKDVRAAQLLLSFLEHDDPTVRARAAFSLGSLGDPTVCDDLETAMEDVDAEVRAEAAEALGKLQCETAIRRLSRGLDDEDLSVRMNSAVALSQLGQEGRAVLEELLLTTEETQREVAAEVLGTARIMERDNGEGK